MILILLMQFLRHFTFEGSEVISIREYLTAREKNLKAFCRHSEYFTVDVSNTQMQ
jgi:hypothetical protein